MANETRALAGFAASLTFDELPEAVIHRAKQCIADTVAAMHCFARWITASGSSSNVSDAANPARARVSFAIETNRIPNIFSQGCRNAACKQPVAVPGNPRADRQRHRA